MNVPAGWIRSELLLICGSLLSLIAILGIVASLLMRERNDALLSATRAASNIVRLIEADVVRSAELYDASINGMINAWQHERLRQLPDDLRHQVLFDRAAAAPYKGDLLLLDQNGNVLADSLPGARREENFADRPFFQHHRDSNLPGLHISQPFKARWGFKDWCISFSRRLSGPNGEFLGVAGAAMRLAYFKPLFRSQSLGPDSSLSLMNTQGVLLVREPVEADEDQTGTVMAGNANYQHILELPEGSFVGMSVEHRHRHLYTFSRVRGLPLVVVISQPESAVYAAWQRNALLVGSATGVLCLGILWLTVLLRRELRRRQRAENILAGLAATDALTGLPNRRQLDLTLASEWSRAQRCGDPLSLLMIDVDHFRRFNERHGHLGGDKALRQVAQCIAGNARRAGDFAARYGGEEFLLILPNTERQGALAMAETIRQAIMTLPAVEHDQQAITVSIGVTTASVSKHDDLSAFIESADKALYNAKHHGRNRVEFIDYAQTPTARAV
ncbi:GGDEF domain-containing protein [Pseudomonas sp. StFLB209]|uniref:GGDEF domain-containing protein n=1 Tax=Pseudomonas sp. StFLB209 TaxID=1028989 RepID=UPI0005EF53E7|nr:sensor domain-containing diguanylate cyclase [Pseudomonas sp. StFLB209]